MNRIDVRGTFSAGGRTLEMYRIAALGDRFPVDRLPFSIKILLENLLRTQDGNAVTGADIEALASWSSRGGAEREIAFTPSRVLLQDFTGVPAVVDLAAMRDAMVRLGGDPGRINPLQPVELVIDHSVQVDEYGTPGALAANAALEAERNRERYVFLRWGQKALENFRVVPPDTGIVHQVNLEYLARVVFVDERGVAYPDTLVGTDSHTTMINGLGVLGWGVGGIEAEAAMLGQPVSMLIPEVVGFRLTGKLPEGSTATDLVLTVTEMLRRKGVVGKFVEFHGSGLDHLSLADRATIANMAPEYGATCGLFPIDDVTLRYLRLSGRSDEQIQVVEAYARAQGMFRDAHSLEAEYSDTLSLDLGQVEPSLAGPKRPQDRISLGGVRQSYRASLSAQPGRDGGTAVQAAARVTLGSETFELTDGAIVIGAITSCTNTSNPAVMMAAGLLARKARQRGLRAKPWVKTSLAPGSKVVTEYLKQAGLLVDLEAMGFHLVGYGCTTCIGNSGPLPPPIERAVREEKLVVAAVLSGNRNFEGRIHPQVRLNYLASPPLVVAYSLAGTMDLDLTRDPLGEDPSGQPVYLRDVWPSSREVSAAMETIQASMFTRTYAEVFRGDEHWNALEIPEGDRFRWDEHSTYIRQAPFFQGMGLTPEKPHPIENARVLALLGDSVTTDHISPAGSFSPETPAGRYLVEHGVEPRDFNSYGARRGNHEVMMRGTFANVRLRNRLAPGTEGGFTVHLPDGEEMTIFDAALRYAQEKVPLLVIAGKEYGTGSSRDWAAKGPRLLGVRAVIAESFERIHRSNLIGMGILPLQFRDGQNAESLKLTGKERYTLRPLGERRSPTLEVVATPDPGAPVRFTVAVRIDTDKEFEYFSHGGILNYVLRRIHAAT